MIIARLIVVNKKKGGNVNIANDYCQNAISVPHNLREEVLNAQRASNELLPNQSWGIVACTLLALTAQQKKNSEKGLHEMRVRAKTGAGDSMAKKVKLEEDSIQYDTREAKRECRYCKKSLCQRHFSSSQWDKEKRTCRSCGKRREKEKLCRGKDITTVSSHSGTMRIMLAKKPGAEAKFLCEVVPVSYLSQNDLPSEITLEGYTRQEWGMVSDNDARDWKMMHFKSVDDKRYLEGFLENLSSRRKAAFGAFALPNGTCGVLVVPFFQPEPDGYVGKKGKFLFCKYVLGLDCLEQEGEYPLPSSSKQPLSAATPVNTGQDFRLIEPKTTQAFHQSSDEDEPDSKLAHDKEAGVTGTNSSLRGMLQAQVATNETASTAPKVQRTPMATVGVPTRGYAGPTKQTWFGWRNLGSRQEDEHS